MLAHSFPGSRPNPHHGMRVHCASSNARSHFDRPCQRCGRRRWQKFAGTNGRPSRRRWPPGEFELHGGLLGADKQLVGIMFRAGVPLLAGTDAMNPFCFPGFSLHDELALLVESGLTPLAALQSATPGRPNFSAALKNSASSLPASAPTSFFSPPIPWWTFTIQRRFKPCGSRENTSIAPLSTAFSKEPSTGPAKAICTDSQSTR